MIDLETLEYFENSLKLANCDTIHTSSKNQVAILSGLKGEQSAFKVLTKFSNEIFRNVVIWNKSHTLTTEVDFVSVINGYLVLIEAKEWYGSMDNHLNSSKVYLNQLNLSGRFYKQERMSPIAAIGGFSSDLINHLKSSNPIKKPQLRKIVLFTRNDLQLIGDFSKNNVKICYLINFEDELLAMKNDKNESPYQLLTPLPSWDHYFDSIDNCWYKIVITGNTIETLNGSILVSKISSIIFDESDFDLALIKFKNDELLQTKINRKTITLNSQLVFAKNRIKFIKFDKYLHDDSSLKFSN